MAMSETQATGQLESSTPEPLPGMPEPVAASDVTAATPDGTSVHDMVYAFEVTTIQNPKPEPHPILKHFEFGHLPIHLAEVSKEFHTLAHKLHDTLPMGAELIAGLRKLLEAKDCAVRAANEK